METQLINEDDSYFFYEATSPGFSYFAICGVSGSGFNKVEVEEPEVPEEGTAPLPLTTVLLIGILATVAGIYYWKYSMKK